MKYIFTGLSFIAIVLFIFFCYRFYVGLIKVDLNITGLKKKYKTEETINFNIRIKNLSKTEKCFVVYPKMNISNNKIDFVKTLYILSPNESKTDSYSYNLHNNINNGKSNIQIELKNKTIYSEKLLSEEVIPFEIVKPPQPQIKTSETFIENLVPITGELYVINRNPKVNIGENFIIETVVKNTSNRKGKFNIKLNIRNSETDNVLKTMEKRIDLLPGITGKTTFEYTISKDIVDGEYIITSQLFSEEEKTTRLLSSATTVMYVIDQPPNIIFKTFPLMIGKKNEMFCEVSVSDDREVKNVEFIYQDIDKNKTTNYAMNLISGDKSSGIWSVSMNIKKKKGKFKYYVKAVDNKNLESKTTENVVSVIKK
jgi:hypothetical protein